MGDGPLYHLQISGGAAVDVGSVSPGAIATPSGATFGTDGEGEFCQLNGTDGFFWPAAAYGSDMDYFIFIIRFTTSDVTERALFGAFNDGSTQGYQVNINPANNQLNVQTFTRRNLGGAALIYSVPTPTQLNDGNPHTVVFAAGPPRARSAIWVDGEQLQDQTAVSLGDGSGGSSVWQYGMRTGARQNRAAQDQQLNGKIYQAAYFGKGSTVRDALALFGQVPARPSNECLPGGVWTWFSQPNAKTNGTKSWIGGINAGTANEVCQIDNATGNIDHTSVVSAPFEADDHNNPSFCFLGNGKVMAVWCDHADDNKIFYRISTNVGDTASWGPLKEIEVEPAQTRTSYAQVYRLSAEGTGNGRVYIMLRSGSSASGSWIVLHSDVLEPEVADWTTPVILVNPNPSGYIVTGSNEIDRIWIGAGTSSGANQQGVYYAVFKNNSVWNSEETVEIGLGASLGAWDHVYDADAAGHAAWVWDASEDTVVWLKYTAGAAQNENHEFWFTRRTGGSTWISNKIVDAGGAFAPKNPTPYSAGICINQNNRDQVYYVTNGGEGVGPYELFKAETGDNGMTWTPTSVVASQPDQLFRPVCPATYNIAASPSVEIFYCDAARTEGYDYFVNGANQEGWGSNIMRVQGAALLTEGFAIERSDDGVSGWAEIGRVALTTLNYTDSGQIGTKWYRVREFNTITGNFSGYSNTDSGTAP